MGLTYEARQRAKAWSARNVEASRTNTDVACPLCKQGVGEVCMTSGYNEAWMPHRVRVRARLAQMEAEGR